MGVFLIGLRLYHRRQINKELSKRVEVKDSRKVFSFEQYYESTKKLERCEEAF